MARACARNGARVQNGRFELYILGRQFASRPNTLGTPCKFLSTAQGAKFKRSAYSAMSASQGYAAKMILFLATLTLSVS